MSSEQTQLPSIRTLFEITFKKWFYDSIPRHASVLTFSALFAVAPILLFAFEIMGLVYGSQRAERLVLAQIEDLTDSPAVVDLTTTLLENTLPSSASWWVTASFIIVLIYCVSSFFVELKFILNHIWGISVSSNDGIWEFIVSRLQAIFMGLIGGLLIFSGLMITILLTMVTGRVALALNLDPSYAEWSYVILLFVLLTILFGLTYKFVPNVKIAWQDVLVGAAATALLFSISRLLINWYFSYSYLNTMFGATSALVIMLLWVYYSAQIVLLGAEFTYIYGHTYGAWWRGDPISLQYAARPTEQNLEYIYTEDLSILLQREMIGQNLSNRLSIVDKRSEEDDEMVHNSGILEADSATDLATENIEQPAQEQTKRRKWYSNVYQRIWKPFTHRTVIEHQEGINTETHLVQNEAQYNSDESIPIENRTRISRLRGRIHTFGQQVKRILRLPLRIVGSVRDFAFAVGVIGAISIAALVGIPWWRKRENGTEETAE